MKTQKAIEIFEKFERERFNIMQKNKKHFEEISQIIQHYTTSLPENELINLYVQLMKHGKVFKDSFCFRLEGTEYNGNKREFIVEDMPGSNEEIEISGDTYRYKMNKNTFFGVYEEMMKACGYSKKAVKKLRSSLNEGKIKSRQTKKVKEKQTTVRIVDYSEKAIAVFGETKPYKDQFSEIWGRYNRFLKNENGEKEPGWIFSKKRTDQVKEIINQ